MSYTRKTLTYTVLQYSGDTAAVTTFGATWASTGNDAIQILVDCRDGQRAVGVGGYILKDMAGNFTVATSQDFSDYYQLA